QPVPDGEVQTNQPAAVRVGQRSGIAVPHGFEDVQRGIVPRTCDCPDDPAEVLVGLWRSAELVLEEPPGTVPTVPSPDEIEHVVEGRDVSDSATAAFGSRAIVEFADRRQ